MKRIATILLLIASLTATSQVFTDDLPGIDSIRVGRRVATIYDMYNDGDSLLYITGGISKVNDIPVNFAFAWDGENIMPMSIDNESLAGGGDCIIKYNDTIYGGGI